MGKNATKPYFSYSVNGSIWSGVFIGLIFIISGFLLEPLSPGQIGQVVAGIIAFSYPIYYWSRTVRTAVFFEARAVFAGRNYKREIDYSQVLSVERIKRMVGAQVSIQLKGEARKFTIWNPTNKTLNSDLYTWLLGKTGNKT